MHTPNIVSYVGSYCRIIFSEPGQLKLLLVAQLASLVNILPLFPLFPLFPLCSLCSKLVRVLRAHKEHEDDTKDTKKDTTNFVFRTSSRMKSPMHKCAQARRN